MPTVFVSSTSRDLGPYREAALLACRDLGLAAIGMEDFEAMGLGATAGSLHKLDQADVYLGIFAHRYGFVEPGHDRSVTECEFDHARQRGLECLCFVVDGKYPWPPDAIEFEQRARLDAFKKRVGDLLIINWFTTVEDFRFKAHKALAAWKQRGEGTAARQAQLPRQLPPGPKDFVGRDDILAKLDGQLAGGCVLCGIHGLGGVGKTTLALKLAERLAPRYPDGHIYLDLKGVGPKPLTWQEAMAHVLCAFHPEDRVPSGEAELAGRYRSVLSGRRVLLLWDNAAGGEQVEPLLPPGGDGLVLVTSRRRFHLAGLAACDLDALPPADALALLRSIAPRLGEGAAALAERCGYLPLALRLAGATLAERDDLSPQQYLRRLQAARLAELDGVAASLRLSEELLPEPLRSKWRELAVTVGGFEGAWAAAVWGADEATADAYLGTLRRGSLLGWDAAAALYRLHDLVREYAGENLDAAARAAAERRHARLFCDALGDAGEMLEKGGAAMAEALRLFDRAWPNAQVGFASLRAAAEEDDEAARLCCAYATRTLHARELRQRPQDRIAWSEAAIGCARRLRDSREEGVLLGDLGRAYGDLGRPREAIDVQLRRLAIAREVGDRLGEGYALGNLGRAYYDLGDFPRAAEYQQRRLAVARQVGHRRTEGIALGNLGRAYAALGQPQRALECYEQALAVARETGDRRSEGYTLGNLGRAYADLGEPRRAVEFHEQHLAIAREVCDRRSEGVALGNLGVASMHLGEPRRAIELFRQALALAGETDDRVGAMGWHWNLGLVHEQEGDLAAGLPHLESCVAYEREIGHADADRRAAHVARLRQRLAGA